MTDVATKSGGDKAQPDDAALIDDASIADADATAVTETADDADSADAVITDDEADTAEADTDGPDVDADAPDAEDEAADVEADEHQVVEPDAVAVEPHAEADEHEVVEPDAAVDIAEDEAAEVEADADVAGVADEADADGEDEPVPADDVEPEAAVAETDAADDIVDAEPADDDIAEAGPEASHAPDEAAAEPDEDEVPVDDDAPNVDETDSGAPMAEDDLAAEPAADDAGPDEELLTDEELDAFVIDAAAAETTVIDAAAAETTVVDAAPTSVADAETAVLAAPGDGATSPGDSPAVGADAPIGGGPDAPSYEWAPTEPQPKKSRKALWIGLAAGVAVVALAVASVTLIAPGTSIAGVPVGFLPPAAATDAVQQRLATTTIVLTGEGGDAELTGADLGASVDASGLVADAYAANPLWNVTAWFPASVDAPVRIDHETANSALRAAAPDLYTDPVDATLAFDATSDTYVTTPAEAGAGIDVDEVRAALQEAFAAGETRVELETTVAPVVASTPTYVAEASAERLNGMLTTAGFYVGSERTVPVSRAVAASWLTVTPGDRGTFDITADPSAIDEVVATLPKAIDRKLVNATVITDSGGEVLSEVTPGVSGRELGDTAGLADEFAAQLAAGNARYELPVEESEFATTALERRIEVDLSAQTTYLYENDKVIASYAISSGLPATPTHTGSFRIFAHVSIQDMGALCYNPEAQNSYCTEDVPWITYFNGDQGFHGTYWHNNFGNQMSHGCVNMPIDVAKFVYDWAPTGTEVWVHA